MTSRDFLLNESKVFCLLPWINLYYSADGAAHPCCLSAAENMPLGNYNNTPSISEIWNNDAYNEIRNNMLLEKFSPQCNACYKTETLGAISYRQATNSGWGQNYFDLVKPNAPNNAWQLLPKVIDARFSNLCNFKCRYCIPIFSSTISAEINATSNTNIPPLVTISNGGDFVKDLAAYLPKADTVFLAGGESLIMPEHYELLDNLIALNKTDVTLWYNTNLSTLGIKNKDVLAYWKKFSNVVVGASLDVSGARAELLRKGTRWESIVKNRQLMMQQCPDVLFSITPVISCLSAEYVLDFYQEWIDLRLLAKYAIRFNFIGYPLCMQSAVLPIANKKRILDKIERFIDDAKCDNSSDAIQFVLQMTKFKVILMQELPNLEELRIQLRQETDRLDAIRNESTVTVFPELAELLS